MSFVQLAIMVVGWGPSPPAEGEVEKPLVSMAIAKARYAAGEPIIVNVEFADSFAGQDLVVFFDEFYHREVGNNCLGLIDLPATLRFREDASEAVIDRTVGRRTIHPGKVLRIPVVLQSHVETLPPGSYALSYRKRVVYYTVDRKTGKGSGDQKTYATGTLRFVVQDEASEPLSKLIGRLESRIEHQIAVDSVDSEIAKFEALALIDDERVIPLLLKSLMTVDAGNSSHAELAIKRFGGHKAFTGGLAKATVSKDAPGISRLLMNLGRARYRLPDDVHKTLSLTEDEAIRQALQEYKRLIR